jgi:hypothetical protein
MNVHQGLDVRTPRTMKSPLPGAPDVEVVLRHIHRHCYKSSSLWFIVGGAKSLELTAMDKAWWTQENSVLLCVWRYSSPESNFFLPIVYPAFYSPRSW